MKPYKLAVLACSAKKLTTPAPARDLYQGELFRLALALAERLAERVVVLSAKHGVVDLDTRLEPYEQSLATLDKGQRERWGEQVARDLLARMGVADRTDVQAGTEAGRRILMLAPDTYVRHIGHCYMRTWHRPLLGKGIGQQKAWLAAQAQRSLAARILELDRQWPGCDTAPMIVDSTTWAELVAAARAEQ